MDSKCGPLLHDKRSNESNGIAGDDYREMTLDTRRSVSQTETAGKQTSAHIGSSRPPSDVLYPSATKQRKATDTFSGTTC